MPPRPLVLAALLAVSLPAPASWAAPKAREAAKARLGRYLFFDKRLSRDFTTSCATCHNPQLGWTDHRPTVLGVREQIGERNAPTLINVADRKIQFWDGHAPTLEAQALDPIANPKEMDVPHAMAASRIAAVRGYRRYFLDAFGDPKVTIGRIAEALASFERGIRTGHAPYDRYQAGDKAALSESATRGLELFKGKANCATCHSGPDLTDDRFYNLGVGMQRRQLDLGRYRVTKKDEDRGAFKTPTLRNLADTFPYMHDGSEATLADTIDFFDRGGQANPWLSKEIKPLGLTSAEKQDLLAFLSALNGDEPKVDPPKRFPR